MSRAPRVSSVTVSSLNARIELSSESQFVFGVLCERGGGHDGRSAKGLYAAAPIIATRPAIAGRGKEKKSRRMSV